MENNRKFWNLTKRFFLFMLVYFSACQTNKPDETQIQAWNQFVAEFPKIELPIDFHSSTKDDFSMELDQLREIPVEQVQKFINPDYKATQRDYLNYYYYGAVNLSPQLTGLLVTKFQSGVVTLSLQIFSQKDLQRTSEVLLFESTMQDNPVGFAEIISRVRKDLKVKVVQIMDMISTESPLARHATIHEYQILPDGKIQDLGIREAESKLEDSEDF